MDHRRMASLLLALAILMLCMSGCAADKQGETAYTGGSSIEPAASEPEAESPGVSEAHSGEESTAESKPPEKHILVAYFSATGNTAPLAGYAAEILNADLYEIVPEEPYTEADLAYYTDCRADREQNDPAARPAILGAVDRMEQYDTVVIGHPIWHGQAPRIISTFLESYDFSGKTLVTFCTSHSSGLGSSAENLHGLVPDDVLYAQVAKSW